MRIAFMGTPDFAVPTLDALIGAGHEIAAVYTQPPRPAGRGKALLPSPVQKRAEEAGLEVRAPISLKGEAEQRAFADLWVDVAVVAAYGLILPEPILKGADFCCLNVHASLLPRWRGAAPIQRAILAGDAVTGVTIMQMEAGLDTGPMISARETPVAGKTAGDLTAELAAIGAALVVEALAAPINAVPQPAEGVTLAPKIDKAEARLDFTHPAVQLERAVRAFNPAPGAWTMIGGERLKLLAAEIVPGSFTPGVIADTNLTFGTGDGGLRPTWVQRAGKPAMSVADLRNGWSLPPGTPVDPA